MTSETWSGLRTALEQGDQKLKLKKKERKIHFANDQLRQNAITPLEMIDSLRSVPNIQTVNIDDVPSLDDDDMTSEEDQESDLSSLPSIDARSANLTDGDFEPVALNDVLPPTWIQQSQHLIECIESCVPRYQLLQVQCALSCGTRSGNLVMNPCGHSGYCIMCLRRLCTTNDTSNTRYRINCPECATEIERISTYFVRK